MAKVRIMYWKEIPIQVQAEDQSGEVSAQLDDRFQQGADIVAMFDKSYGADEYLMGWQWGEYTEESGTVQEALTRIVDRFNTRFPDDFSERIRELHQAGERDPRPGAIDHWVED